MFLITIGLINLYTEEYFKLKYFEETTEVNGKFSKFTEIESDTYSKYGFVNNPEYYITATLLEYEFQTYTATVTYNFNEKKYAAFFPGFEQDELDKYRRSVPLLINENKPEIAVLNDWWFDWWIPITLIGMGVSLYLFGNLCYQF